MEEARAERASHAHEHAPAKPRAPTRHTQTQSATSATPHPAGDDRYFVNVLNAANVFFRPARTSTFGS